MLARPPLRKWKSLPGATQHGSEGQACSEGPTTPSWRDGWLFGATQGCLEPIPGSVLLGTAPLPKIALGSSWHWLVLFQLVLLPHLAEGLAVG